MSAPLKHLRYRAIAILSACMISLGVLASPALADASHVFTTTFGSATSTPANPYPLAHPTDVAVDLTTHDVYVTDSAEHRIEKFDSSGHLLLMFGEGVNKTQVLAKAPQAQQNVCMPSVDECQSGTASSTPGGFDIPTFIAVDNSTGPSAGDVYVADTSGTGFVSKFGPTGTLIASWGEDGQFARTNGINGIAVNPVGDLIVMSNEYAFRVARYSQSGSPIGEFTTFGNGTEEQGIAVDARERFYRGGNSEIPRVSEFNEAGTIAEEVTHGPITGIQTDPMSTDLYVTEQGTFISHFQSQCGEHCTPLETFGNGDLSGARGISIDAPSDNVYVANTGDNDVAVFDGVGPYTTTGPATNVGHTTATLTGQIAEGGRGEITGCHFEYGTGESYEGGSVPCEPAAPYGSEADVSAKLIGLQPETTYHYRLVASNSSGTVVGVDRTFTPHFVLDVTTEPATNVTKETAELNGSYVGDGTPTSYHFEYGPKETYEESTPEQSAGSNVGPQSLSPSLVEGLQPHTTYHYRLVAKNSSGTTYGQDLTFATGDRPEIGHLSSSEVTETGAMLHARISPRGADTTYHFEYGTTTSYGINVPIPNEDIGSGQSPVEVSQTLTHLQANTTYHFRVVAENVYGKTVSEDQDLGFFPPRCPNATLRQETSSNWLPDCRGYELVSPADAGSTSLYPLGPNSAEATDPSRLAFGGWLDTVPGAGDPVNVFGDLYVSTRTNQGWVTKYVGIPGVQTNNTNGPPGEPSNGFFLNSPDGTRTNLSMSKFLDWNINDFGFAAVGPPPDFAPHVWEADGTSLGEWPTASGYPPGPLLNQAPDFSHYYFISGGTTQRYGEYEEYFTYTGGTAYDNNVAGGTVAPIAFDSQGASISVKGVPQSSIDGSRILMSTATCEDQAASSCSPGELFMRVGDALTYNIAPGHSVQYVGMTGNGSEVYFTSSEQLTPKDTDTSIDLYMWSEATDALTLVSAGSNGSAGNSDACTTSWTEKCGVMPIVNRNFSSPYTKGGVLGNGLSDNTVAAASGDIYFLSPERLDGTKGVTNQANLYLYRNGTIRYVAALEPQAFCEQESCSSGPIVRMQVSPDGSHMAFLTASRVTAYDNAHQTELYSYSPATEEVICVSCRPTGTPPTSDVWVSSDGRFMTNDGRTFFSTGDALVPRDTDGLRDVYEYVEGRPQLISSGTSSKDSERVLVGINYGLYVAGLVGVSANGTDVYFTTYDTLVPQDRNGGYLKFYDARTNGGFAFNVPPAPCEAADECVGNGSSPTERAAATSRAVLGGGNVVETRASRNHHRRKPRHRPKRRRHGSNRGGRGHG